jgi:hypothetical protein
MQPSQINELVAQLENYLECWKQFIYYINMARSKKFGPDDETQFMEVKSIIIQQLELILDSIEIQAVSKEDIHAVLSGAPSIRYISEMNEGSLRGLENQWHKIYISWQSILGQMKVQQRRAMPAPSMWKKLFGG